MLGLKKGSLSIRSICWTADRFQPWSCDDECFVDRVTQEPRILSWASIHSHILQRFRIPTTTPVISICASLEDWVSVLLDLKLASISLHPFGWRFS